MQDEAEDPLIGRVIGRRYQVVRRLARGGSATIYVAVQRPLGREVAVKVIRTDLDDDARREVESRFLREARLASRLQHPNVVTYLDAGVTQSGLRYVVMELLRGRTVRTLLHDAPLPADQVARLGTGIARGLHHAHQSGLVHRDVKPGNVFLVSSDDGLERPVIVDFGIVKDAEADSQLTVTGTFVGTPTYAAPEQVRGDLQIGPKADVYALGCVLYRMLTGMRPYAAATGLGVALAHLNEPYPPMAERAPDTPVPPSLEAIVRGCMHKEPDRRPTAEEVATQLDHWLAQQVAPRSPAVEVSAPPRRPGLLAVSAAGGLALLVGVAAVSVTSLRGEGPPVPGELATPSQMDATAPPLEPEARAEVPPVATISEAAPTRAEGSPGPAPEPTPPATPAQPPAPAPVDEAPARPPAAAKSPPRAASKAPEPPVEVEGLTLSAEHARRLIAFVNGASPADLSTSGVYDDGVRVLLKLRPFRDVPELAATRGIGPSTLRALAAHTSDTPSRFLKAPDPVVTEQGELSVDEVAFAPEHAERALAFLNSATPEELAAAGIYDRGVEAILERRPFESLSAFGAAPLIGTKTVQRLYDHTR